MGSKSTPENISPQPGRSWLAVIIAVALFIVLAIIFIGAAVSDYDETSETDAPAKATFTNLLTPTSEIKLGDSRYVSLCQALTLSDVTDIFDKTDGNTRVSEDAMLVSVPKSDDGRRYETSCVYNLAKSTVTLRADQYSDPAAKKQVADIFVGTGKDFQEKLTELKQATASSTDPEAKQLVTDIENSLTRYQKFEDEYDESVLAKQNFDGMILPEMYGSGIAMLKGDALYTLSYEPEGLKDPLTAAEVLGKLERGLKLVAKKAADKQLEQSPINTILGKSDKIGSTKILEPCVVLSTDAFKAITGTVENDVVSRNTLPVDASRNKVDQKVNKRIILSNICTRQSEIGDINTSADLQLYQARTVAYAQQYVKDFHDDPSTPAPTAIQTSADEAFVFANSQNPDSPTYLFRVGAYVGIIRLMTSDSTGSGLAITQASQDQHISAINALAERIKQQL